MCNGLKMATLFRPLDKNLSLQKMDCYHSWEIVLFYKWTLARNKSSIIFLSL